MFFFFWFCKKLVNLNFFDIGKFREIKESLQSKALFSCPTKISWNQSKEEAIRFNSWHNEVIFDISHFTGYDWTMALHSNHSLESKRKRTNTAHKTSLWGCSLCYYHYCVNIFATRKYIPNLCLFLRLWVYVTYISCFAEQWLLFRRGHTPRCYNDSLSSDREKYSFRSYGSPNEWCHLLGGWWDDWYRSYQIW